MKAMQVQKVLCELRFPSTAVEDVIFEDPGGCVRIRYTRERDEDEYVTGGIEFERSRAYRYRAESHSTVWHLEAYGKVVEVEGSEWVEELIEATAADLRNDFTMHHYMIYFDSYGCYEVVAESWDLLPEFPEGGEGARGRAGA